MLPILFSILLLKILMRQPQLNRNYLVIFGDISKGKTPEGKQYAYVERMTDKMMLPACLLDVIPQQVINNVQLTATDYVIPELFDGDVSFKPLTR
jgi:hypothetical protein